MPAHLLPDEGLPPELLRMVDTVGADIFARLVTDWLSCSEDGLDVEIDGPRFDQLANFALAAAIAWGMARHQTCEPCADRGGGV